MSRLFCFELLLTLTSLGCQQQASPPATSFAKYDLDGGRYVVEIQDTEGGSSLDFQSKGQGSAQGEVVKQERYNLSWGKSRRLQIENGVLSVDGANLGELKPGDRIVVSKSGKTLVNGAER
jgi:hypothetical protein